MIKVLKNAFVYAPAYLGQKDVLVIGDKIARIAEHINEYDLTIFSKEGELFRKSVETHFQRGYTVEEMTGFIEAAGMVVLEVLDEETHLPPTEETERVQIIAKEQGK